MRDPEESFNPAQAIKVGSIVKVLGIPSPSMRVMAILEDDMVELVWFSSNSKIQSIQIDSSCLGVM
jgi:hypothetical protein